jgi:hypothetical protein
MTMIYGCILAYKSLFEDKPCSGQEKGKNSSLARNSEKAMNRPHAVYIDSVALKSISDQFEYRRGSPSFFAWSSAVSSAPFLSFRSH